MFVARFLLRLMLGALLVTLGTMPLRVTAGAYKSGSVSCPTSGAKQLSTSVTKATWVSAQAPSANGGKIYFGGSSVTTSEGNYITAGGVNFFPPVSNTSFYDLSQIWFACGTNTDTLTYSYAQ